MKVNGHIQLYPLLRISVMLILGIFIGSYSCHYVSGWIWIALTFSCLLAALLINNRPMLVSVLILFASFFYGEGIITFSITNERANSIVEQKTEYEAVVLGQPVKKEKTAVCEILLLTQDKPLIVKCLFMVDESDLTAQNLHAGDGIIVRSEIKKEGYTFINNGEWKPAVVDVSHLSLLTRTKIFALEFRDNLLKKFFNDETQVEELIVAALALGNKTAISNETRHLYSIAGISHVLALSGLHLGIIYTMIMLLFPKKRLRVFSQCLILLFIWGYVLLTGFSFSVVRSAIMLTIFGVLSVANRKGMSLNTLSFAVIVMLVFHPKALWDVGFQLSFMAVLAILLFYQPIRAIFGTISNRFLRYVVDVISVSLAAQIGTFPLVLHYFGQFSNYFMLSNIIIIPVVCVILFLSFIMFCSYPIDWLFIFIKQILIEVVEWLNKLVVWISHLPGASFENVYVTVSQTLAIYIFIGSVSLMMYFFRKPLIR